jgi:hypothetical protein
MNITTEQMPGVAEPGAKAFWVIGRRNYDINVLSTFTCQGVGDLEHRAAQREALIYATRFDEVIVVYGTLKFRVWDRDKVPAPAADFHMTG